MRDAAKRLLSFWHAGHAGRVPLLITNDLWAKGDTEEVGRACVA